MLSPARRAQTRQPSWQPRGTLDAGKRNRDQTCRISNNAEFESAFAAMEKDRPDAIIVQPSLPSKRAAELALQHRMPAISVPRWFIDEGGLMSYSAIYADLFRKAAAYVDKILKGAQPADLPVEQPFPTGHHYEKPPRRLALPCHLRCSPAPTR
jgi:hypothetical protein